MPEYHESVLLNETITLLDPKEGGVYVDATLGGGGHAAAVLERIGSDGLLIGIDRDADAIEHAAERFKQYGDRVKLIQANFRDLAAVLKSLNISRIDGAVFDLGVSSHQLDTDRGFSFMRDEALDMRMSETEDTANAADIVNSYNTTHLADVIWKYGEERYSRQIARAIFEVRVKKPITSTKQLADIIVSVVGSRYRGQDIHPATRTFQALRIEVNKELESVEIAVPAAIEALNTAGKISVISFHSLEDRIVKNIFRRFSGRCECPPRLPGCVCGAKKIVDIITKKPVTASTEEINRNPRSRSAKLRCAVRIA